MTSTEYQTLSDKIDKLDAKIDNQMLPRPEYEKAHEALEFRVKAVEQKLDSWAVAGRAEVTRIETATSVKYDKLEAKIDGLDTKIDGLKENMVLRFENQGNQQAANRKDNTRWAISLTLSLLGGGGIGAIFEYLTHLGH